LLRKFVKVGLMRVGGRILSLNLIAVRPRHCCAADVGLYVKFFEHLRGIFAFSNKISKSY